MKRVRTRFAPSPTGMMHVGNLRTALFEYLVAKHDEGDFLLRVEDTDQKRKVDNAIEFIYDTLSLCNINIDEGPNNPGSYGPYMQSERVEIYEEYAKKLVSMGKAYYCFCSEERLTDLREKAEARKEAFMYDRHCYHLSSEEIEEKLKNNEPYVIRQLINKEGTSTYEDVVYGKISVENDILEDQILLKSDGFPTYNFANVIDDHLMEITHIIRGNEYIMSTAKYNQIYDAFGWEIPVYIHVPMVLGEDGQKLSKRNGDASFMDLYNDGYIPEAIINYLILLGWSPETNDEIFSMEELIRIFSPTRISKSPSQFDIKKLQWINAHYVKNLTEDELYRLTLPHLKEKYDLKDKSERWIKDLVLLYKDELKYGKEIVELVSLFFENTYSLNEEAKEFMLQEGISNTVKVFKECLEAITDWNIQNITESINSTKEKSGSKGKMLYMPIRIQLTGQMHGPELPNTIYLLGKDKALERLK